MRDRRVSVGLAAGVATLALLAGPSLASAADTYVDDDTGNDSDPCTQAQPCKTVQQGIDTATAGATVFVDPDTYNENTVLSGGKSLRASDFALPTETALPIVEGGGGTGITVPVGGSAGLIEGLSVHGNTQSINLDGPATVRGNELPDSTGNGIAVIAPGSVIEGNKFNDPDATGAQTGVIASADAQILDNQFTSLHGGIAINNSSVVTVRGNDFAGSHPFMSTSGGGISVLGSRATVVDNTFHSPGAGISIAITGSESGNPTGITMRRNTITGYYGGVGMDDASLGVDMSGDVIANTTGGSALQVRSFTVPTDLTATNVSLVGNTTDIFVKDNQVTLDSVIVEDPIQITGAVNCTIRFSRGPTTTGTPCQTFQTSVPPSFANAGTGDLHLIGPAALIDHGNPAAPAAGILDVDGDPRVCDGDGDGALRRDIGADEIRTPASDDCVVPDTRIRRPRVNRARQRARIRFSADPGSTFECKLDRRPFRSCRSPKVYRNLHFGRHRLKVRATDSFGNEELDPTVRRFRVRPPR